MGARACVRHSCRAGEQAGRCVRVRERACMRARVRTGTRACACVRGALGGELAQALEEGLVGHDEARVAHDRLEDDAADLILVGLEERLWWG